MSRYIVTDTLTGEIIERPRRQPRAKRHRPARDWRDDALLVLALLCALLAWI